MSTAKPKHAPFYAKALAKALQDLKTDTTIHLSTHANVTATIEFKNPIYITQGENYVLTNSPVLNIKTDDYNLIVEVNNTTRVVSLKDTKTYHTIYEITFENIDALQTISDMNINSRTYAFLNEVIIGYQILKYVPQTTTVSHDTAEEITAQVATSIERTLQHFIDREKEQQQSREKDMEEITSVINYLNSISTESVEETNSLELQVKATTNGTTFIVTIADNIKVNIVDPQDANITYEVQYEYDDSVLHVLNNNTNTTVQTIPTFILCNTKMNEEELQALRNTYNLFDATCQAFRVMQYFYNTGTYKITDKAYDIKQQVYSSLGNSLNQSVLK